MTCVAQVFLLQVNLPAWVTNERLNESMFNAIFVFIGTDIRISMSVEDLLVVTTVCYKTKEVWLMFGPREFIKKVIFYKRIYWSLHLGTFCSVIKAFISILLNGSKVSIRNHVKKRLFLKGHILHTSENGILLPFFCCCSFPLFANKGDTHIFNGDIISIFFLYCRSKRS